MRIEKNMYKIAIACLFLFIAGCVTPQQGSSYPAEITGIGDSSNYPIVAAGFQRGKMWTYAPGMTNISTGYNMYSSQNHIASTIYQYPATAPLNDMFEIEIQNILHAHNIKKSGHTREITLFKNGNSYRALEVTFQYESNFMGKQQNVFSQLVLWEYKGKFFKLRSTSPLSEGESTIAKNVALLEAVNWAF